MELTKTAPITIMSSEYLALREIDLINKDLRERNMARAEAMKIQMGRKYVLHPENAPAKQIVQSVLR